MHATTPTSLNAATRGIADLSLTASSSSSSAAANESSASSAAHQVITGIRQWQMADVDRRSEIADALAACVTAHEATGRYPNLNLTDANATELPPQLFDLPLTSLTIACPQLQLPEEIGRMQPLKSLSLISSPGFDTADGNAWQAISGLKQLKHLALERCDVSEIPDSFKRENFRSLKTLVISSSKFERVPPALAKFPYVDLSENNLSPYEREMALAMARNEGTTNGRPALQLELLRSQPLDERLAGYEMRTAFMSALPANFQMDGQILDAGTESLLRLVTDSAATIKREQPALSAEKHFATSVALFSKRFSELTGPIRASNSYRSIALPVYVITAALAAVDQLKLQVIQSGETLPSPSASSGGPSPSPTNSALSSSPENSLSPRAVTDISVHTNWWEDREQFHRYSFPSSQPGQMVRRRSFNDSETGATSPEVTSPTSSLASSEINIVGNYFTPEEQQTYQADFQARINARSHFNFSASSSTTPTAFISTSRPTITGPKALIDAVQDWRAERASVPAEKKSSAGEAVASSSRSPSSSSSSGASDNPITEEQFWKALADPANAAQAGRCDAFAHWLKNELRGAAGYVTIEKDLSVSGFNEGKRRKFVERVNTMLDALVATAGREHSEPDMQFRSTCLAAISFGRSCVDGSLEVLGQMERARAGLRGAHLVEEFRAKGEVGSSNLSAPLLNAGLQLFRAANLQVVGESFAAALEKATGVNEEVEVQLHLEMAHGRELNIPSQTTDMAFQGDSGLKSQDIASAREKVVGMERANNSQALIDYLSGWEPWREHMFNLHATAFEEVAEAANRALSPEIFDQPEDAASPSPSEASLFSEGDFEEVRETSKTMLKKFEEDNATVLQQKTRETLDELGWTPLPFAISDSGSNASSSSRTSSTSSGSGTALSSASDPSSARTFVSL